MLQGNSVRTIWAISTICYPPMMDSTSSLVIFIISTRKKSLKLEQLSFKREFPKFFETFIWPAGCDRLSGDRQDDPTEMPRWGKVGKQKIEDTRDR